MQHLTLTSRLAERLALKLTLDLYIFQHKPNPFYTLGKDFLQSYPHSMAEMQHLQDLNKFGDISKLSSAEYMELKQLLSLTDIPLEGILKKYDTSKATDNPVMSAAKFKVKREDSNYIGLDTLLAETDNKSDTSELVVQDSGLNSTLGALGINRLVHLLRKIQWSPLSGSQKGDSKQIQRDTVEFMQVLIVTFRFLYLINNV